MKLLDLFCGAGGAAMGYCHAGFEVHGVDLRFQPHYPFPFEQADALEYVAAHGHEFDVIHASPPCQAYSQTKHLNKARGGHREYPDLVAPTRAALQTSGRPYVIENVVNAPLIHPVMLCGTMFHMRIYRHRLFESNVAMLQPSHGIHPLRTNAHRGMSGGQEHYVCVCGHNFHVDEARREMGIDWMTRDELTQAIPPAYTRWIGRQLIAALSPSYSSHSFPSYIRIKSSRPAPSEVP